MAGVQAPAASAGSDVSGRREFVDGEIADWANTIATNISGVMRICHALLRSLVDRNRGHVVPIGSTAGVATYLDGITPAPTERGDI